MADHAQRAHALLSASGAYRWMNCTPSARLEDNEPEKTSDFAEEGTLAHELAELLIRKEMGWIKVKDYMTQRTKLEKNRFYSDGMEDPVLAYVEYVLSQLEAAGDGATLLLESKVDLTDYIPEGFGSNDAIIINDGTMRVIDLKFGKGVRVSAQNNPQLKLYALGALRKYELSYDIQNIRLAIMQPRLDAISEWDIPAEELREWGETEVRVKAAQAYAGTGELVAGEHCKFCKVKDRCRAMAAKADELAALEFKTPTLLTDEEILNVYEQGKIITDWISSVDEYVLAQALAGKQWPGYKLVAGRSVRGWSDEDAAANKLLEEGLKADDIFTTKLKGITAIEKLLGKKNFVIMDNFVQIPPGKPTLAPESDKRPALGQDSAKDDFKNC